MRSSERVGRPLTEAEMKTRAELAMILVKGLAKKRGFAEATGRGDECGDVAECALQIISELIFSGNR